MVCVCSDFEKIKRMYRKNYPADKIKILYGVRASVPFFSITSVEID